MLRAFVFSAFVMFSMATIAAAQAPEGTGEQAAPPGQPGAPPPRPVRPMNAMDPTGMLDALTTELKLDEGQQEQAQKFLLDYRTQQIEVRKTLRPAPETSDRTREILTDMRAAQEAGDRDKIKLLSDELRAIRAKQEEQIAPMRQQLQDLQTGLNTNLKGILRPDQQEKFDQIWEERMVRRSPMRGRVRSPQALRSLVEKLPDLSEEQKLKVDELFKAHMEASRESGQNAVAKEKANTQLYDSVLGLLTPEQRDTVNKQLEGRPRMPRQPEAGGTPPQGGGENQPPAPGGQ